MPNDIISEKTRKPNVGLFVDAFFPMVDGVIMVVDNYARRLSNLCNVTVFTLKPRGYKEDNRKYPYKVVQCTKAVLPFLDYDLPLPHLDRNFMHELEAADLDIVHIHSPFTIGKVGLSYAKKHNLPVIANLHSQYKMDFYRATHSKLITNVMLRRIVKVFDRCDELYATNRTFAEVFMNYGLHRLPLVQQNGTDMKPVVDAINAMSFVNKKFKLSDEPVFLFVGRINKLKNIYFLLEALTKLKTKEYKMIFVGDGKDLTQFKKYAMTLPIADKLIFTGRITDRKMLCALYLRAKLMLFPSLYDTNSLVQIEAASQHTPTVFIRGSVTSSLVTDNINGYLSDNSPEAFAKRIDEIMSDDNLYREVCAGAFRDLYVTWDSCIKQMYDRYLEHIKLHKIHHASMNIIH